MTPRWTCRPFAALSVQELYAVMVLRQAVFVVEQRCAFLDCDGYDERAEHLFCHDERGSVAAYCRLFSHGVKFDECSIGRVATSLPARRSGLGRALMREALDRLDAAHGRAAVRIGAQAYLERFYASFGFARCSDDYLEDGIVHLDMRRV